MVGSSRWWPALALLALLASAGATAHDTWFALRPGAGADRELRLALGTGERFPVLTSTVGATLPDQAGCRSGDSPVQPLRVQRQRPEALHLGTTLAPAAAGITCWAQLPPHQVELSADAARSYLDEIRAPDAVRARWGDLAARGLPWTERFTKHARIEVAVQAAAAPATEHLPLPAPLGLDIVADTARPRVGDTLAFQLLRDGAPLAGQAVELVSGEARAGYWLRSDDAGRAAVRLPLPGRWLLRATDLRPDPNDATRWDSRFVTLAFDVGDADAVAPATATR